MKNISDESKSSRSQNGISLVSESIDFARLSSESKLRKLAKAVPEYRRKLSDETVQARIDKVIHASQIFVSEVVGALSVTTPGYTKNLMTASSGQHFTSEYRSEECKKEGWVAPFPVNSYIFHSSEYSPTFGMASLVPAVTLSAGRQNNPYDDFIVTFSVGSPEEIRLLAMMLEESGAQWSRLEKLAGITPFTSIPLSGDNDPLDCLDYLQRFIGEVVSSADEDDCVETFDLNFLVSKDEPLHKPVVSAILVLEAFFLFKHSVRTEDQDKFHSLSMSKLIEAKEIEMGYEFWK